MRLADSVIPRSFLGHCLRTTTSLVSRLTAHPFPKSLYMDSHVLQYTYCKVFTCLPQEALKFVAKYTTEKVRLLAFVKNRGKGGAVRMVCLCFSSFSVSSCVNETAIWCQLFPNSSWYPMTFFRYVCVKNTCLFQPKLCLTPMSPNFIELCDFMLTLLSLNSAQWLMKLEVPPWGYYKTSQKGLWCVHVS